MLNKNKYKLNDFYTPNRKIKISQPNTRLIGIFLAFLLFFNFVAPFIPFFQSLFPKVKSTIPPTADAVKTSSTTNSYITSSTTSGFANYSNPPSINDTNDVLFPKGADKPNKAVFDNLLTAIGARGTNKGLGTDIKGGYPLLIKLFQTDSTTSGEGTVGAMTSHWWQVVYYTSGSTEFITFWMDSPYTAALTTSVSYYNSTMRTTLMEDYNSFITKYPITSMVGLPSQISWQTDLGNAAGDGMWLPSAKEIGYSDGGTWGITNAEQAMQAYSGCDDECWLRNKADTRSVYLIHTDGSVASARPATSSYKYGCRPAIHLNLTAMESSFRYDVQYNANGATSGSVPATQTTSPGTATVVAGNTGNLAKTGYIFAGWNTNAAGTGTTYAAGSSYPAQTAGTIVTLYAKWDPITYTMTATPNTTTPSAVNYGSAGTAVIITVKNTGNSTVSGLSASLSNSNFEISTALGAISLAPNAETTLKVRLKSGMNAGSYSTTVTVSNAQGQSATTDSISQTVNRVAGSATVSITGTVKYNQTLTANVTTSSDGAKSYQWWYTTTANATSGTNINGATSSTYKIGSGMVGRYIGVTVSVAQGTNYNSFSKTAITSSTVVAETGSFTMDTSAVTKTYGDAAFTRAASKTGDGTITYSSSKTGVATVDSSGKVTIKGAGSATITATIKAGTNYNYSPTSLSYTLTVNKAGISPTVSMSGYTYGGTVSTPSVSGNTGSGSVTYYYNTSNSNSGGTAWTNVTSATSLNAGTYYMYAVIGATSNYNGATTNAVSFKISVATPTITLSNKTATYSGSAISIDKATVTGVSGGTTPSGAVSYTYYTDSNCTTKTPTSTGASAVGGAPKNAGTYYVKATIAAAGNYASATSSAATLKINKKGISPTVSMSGYTYGGTVSTPSVSGNTGSGSVTYYYNTSNSNSGGTAWTNVTSATSLNAGTYYMYAVIGATSNYNGATTNAVQFIIDKADGSVTLDSTSGSITYPGTVSFNVTGNTSGGTLSVSSNKTGVATASISGTKVTVTAGTTAGSATITVTSAETDNYNSASASYTITVSNGTISVSASGWSGTYDGNAHSITLSVSSPSGTTIKYRTASSGDYTLTTNPTYTNVGTYTVYYQVSKAGYTTVTGSKQVVIEAKELTIPTLSGTYTYNGSEQTATLSNFDSNTMSVSNNKRTNAGNQNISVSLKNTNNYVWSDGSTTAKSISWTIKQLTVSIKWSTSNSASGTAYSGAYTYNGNTQGVYPFITNIKGSDSVSLTVSNNTATNAGNYTANNLALAGTSKDNYALPTSGTTLAWSIARANTAVLPSQSGSLTYNGSSQSPSWSNYDNVKVSYTGTKSGTNAGNYTATFTPTANYAWSDGTTTAKNVNWTINKASANLEFVNTVSELNYNASSTFTASTSSPETINWTITGSATPSIATGTSVSIKATSGNGTVTVKITVAESDNYLSGQATTSITLQRIAGNITMPDYSKRVGVDTEFTLSPISSHGGVVTYAINSGSSYITLSGNTVTIKSAGTVTLTATCAQTDNYNSATDSFTITISSAWTVRIYAYSNSVGKFTTYANNTVGGTVKVGNSSYSGNATQNVALSELPYTIYADYNNGYRFSGFYYDANFTNLAYGVSNCILNNGVYTAEINSVTENITLYAKFDLNYIQVNYEATQYSPNSLLVVHSSSANLTQSYIIKGNKLGKVYICGIELGHTYTVTLTSAGSVKIDNVATESKSYSLTVNNPTLTVNIYITPATA